MERQSVGVGRIGDHHRALGIEPLEAWMGGIGHRRAARIVIGEDGGELVRRRMAHAVEQGERPSPCRKKRSMGIMRSMAIISAGGAGWLRAAKAWRSGRRSSSSSISTPGCG